MLVNVTGLHGGVPNVVRGQPRNSVDTALFRSLRGKYIEVVGGVHSVRTTSRRTSYRLESQATENHQWWLRHTRKHRQRETLQVRSASRPPPPVSRSRVSSKGETMLSVNGVGADPIKQAQRH